MAFLLPVDIANKALQILGQTRITAADMNSPVTKAGASMSFVYDKLRRAELRRSVWRFATRRAVLRPVSVSTQNFQPSMWASGTTYAAGAVVFFNNYYWILEIPSSTGNQPGTSSVWQTYFGPLTCDVFDVTSSYSVGELVIVPAAWNSGVTYVVGALVSRNGSYYVSLAGGNTNHDPAATTGFWTPWSNQNATPLSFPTGWTVYMSLSNENATAPPAAGWVQLAGSLSQYTLFWPIGAGPLSNTATSNAFVLPNGYVRNAPLNPKTGVGRPLLGGPVYNQPDDFEYEGNIFVSNQIGPVAYRFVADVWDVSAFDDLFSVSLAARIAMDTCEELTSGNDNFKEAAALYKQTMFEALAVNAIEKGPVEAYEDDYLLARL